MSPSFHRYLRLGFALAAGTSLLACFLFNRSAPPARGGLPAGLLDASAAGPEQAKWRHLFWCPEVGALRLLETPELFESLFPGYGEARTDKDLWDRYFQETFDQSAYSRLLMRLGPALASRPISASWLGALDVYRRYGADVLVFGHSGVFAALPAGLLREKLDGAGLPGLKVLQCAKGNLTGELFARSVAELSGAGKKAKLAVWGYSLVPPGRAPNAERIERDVRAAYEGWKARNAVPGFGRRFPHPSWDSMIGAGLQARLEQGEDTRIPDAVAADQRALAARALREAPRFEIRFDEKDCDFSAASREADAALAGLLKTADRVLLFLVPTAPLNRRHAPACLLPSLQAMLRSKAGPRVHVETADWAEFGLTYEDHLHPSDRDGFWDFDTDHVNAAGAEKVAAKVAAWATTTR